MILLKCVFPDKEVEWRYLRIDPYTHEGALEYVAKSKLSAKVVYAGPSPEWAQPDERQSVQLVKAYHGTGSLLPWCCLNPSMIGKGLGGNKCPGYFFSSSFRAAQYFSNYLVAEMFVPVLKEVDNFDDLRASMVPTILKGATSGESKGDTIYVPKDWGQIVTAPKWHLWVDEKDYFDAIDDMLNIKENAPCKRNDIIRMMNMAEGDYNGGFDYAADALPQIKKYANPS